MAIIGLTGARGSGRSEAATALELLGYERAGFRQEGVKRHAFMLDGAFTDLAVMAVLAGEWRAAHPAAAPQPEGI